MNGGLTVHITPFPLGLECESTAALEWHMSITTLWSTAIYLQDVWQLTGSLRAGVRQIAEFGLFADEYPSSEVGAGGVHGLFLITPGIIYKALWGEGWA